MPLYFFLSGCFFKQYEGFVGFIVRKINKLLIPYVFFYLLFRVIYPFLLLKIMGTESPGAPWDALWHWLTTDGVGGPIWFLRCLFIMNIYFYVVFLVSRKNQILIGLISFIVGLTGFTIGFYQYHLPLHLDSAMTALPFFYMGYFVFRKTELLYPNTYDRFNWFLIIALFAVLLLFATKPSYLLNRYESDIPYLWSIVKTYVSGLAGTLMIIVLSKQIKYIPVISYFGRYSIMILCTHRFIYTLVDGVVLSMGLNNFHLLITFIITMLSYLGLIPFMQKYMPHVTAQKDVIKIHRK